MLAKIQTCTVSGVDALPISVEVFMRKGHLPGILTVGLPDTAVKESKDRVFAAMSNSGFTFPLEKITINLAPANVKKVGSGFDLPIAIGLLSAMGIIDNSTLNDTVIIGELSLDGNIKPIRGVLPIAVEASKYGWKKMIVPLSNAPEASVVEDIHVIGANTLRETVDYLKGDINIPLFKAPDHTKAHINISSEPDFSEVKGQEHAKRALEVAAAGGHNVLMIGPPGSGKTMLAKRIPSILPPLTLHESLEITKIYSVSGLLYSDNGLIMERPFRSPHHSISDAGLIGGGSYPMPGEVSLAHNGVLFLDELPEFRRHVLEVLRQPLEDGHVTIARAQMSLTYPSRFILIAAMNPCPCGWKTHPYKACRCNQYQIERYLSKISGPLLDRIDIHLEISSVRFREMKSQKNGESSETIRKRVHEARLIQINRFSKHNSSKKRLVNQNPTYCNAHMNAKDLSVFCKLSKDGYKIMEYAMEKLGLSARAFNRILKVARTIADLAGSENISKSHLAEAIQYRSLDRSYWTGEL